MLTGALSKTRLMSEMEAIKPMSAIRIFRQLRASRYIVSPNPNVSF
jgi:hypothetical protein